MFTEDRTQGETDEKEESWEKKRGKQEGGKKIHTAEERSYEVERTKR